MKLDKIIISFLFLLMTITSCKKQNDDANPVKGNGEMTAKIDGNKFVATVDASAKYIEGTLLISGYNDLQQIQLTIYNPNGDKGEFMMDDMTNYTQTGVYIHSSDINKNYYNYIGNSSGQIELSEFTDINVKGTFHFTAGNMEGDRITITDGTFDVKILD